MKHLWLGLAMLLLLLGRPAAARDDATLWFTITADGGQKIGFASRQVRATAAGREIISEQQVLLAERRKPTRKIVGRTLRREDAAGRTITLESVTQVGADRTRNEARIDGDVARVTRQTGVDRRQVDVPLPARVRFDDGEGLLPEWRRSGSPKFAFESFSLEAMAVERVEMEAAPSLAADPAGSVAVLRRRYEGRELRSLSRLLISPEGQLLGVDQPMQGLSIHFRRADRATATAAHPPYRVLSDVMIKSPFRIPQTAVQGRMRYRFGFRDGLTFTAPDTSDQSVRPDDGRIVIDICQGCGPGLPTDAAFLASALRPTPWLQSDHPRLKAIGEPVSRFASSDARKMEILMRKALPYMGRVDFAGHFSALETMDRRAGDCTEAAVLLAALGRSAGIPTKVVNGLVYSRERYHGVSNAFMPHSWVLAYVDGEWRSYDLAFGAFDSTHIALTVGDGDARSVLAANQLAGLLLWESMAEVRARPAT